MSRTARIHGNSGYYHIVARGVGKQILFEEDADYYFFLGTMKKYMEEESFEVIAYCLMENHFHLVMKIESGMDRIMKKICTRYSFYFNSKYERVGHLFQDRYKSIPIENDVYLLTVVRYVHNNPVKAGICPADKYRWSSWRNYAEERGLVRTDLVLSLVGGISGFLEYSSVIDEENTDTEQLEIHDKRALSDEAAIDIIRNKLHFESGTQIKALPRESRNEALRTLKQEGLTIRQIERLTGINRGSIGRA